MPQEPLTPAGVLQKQTDLYALSNNALLAEANSIRTNFRSWLLANFIFNSTQETYLNGMDDRWVNYTAYQTAFAVENRLPINFDAPVPLPPPSISKMAETEGKTLKAEYSQLNGFVASGALTITLNY